MRRSSKNYFTLILLAASLSACTNPKRGKDENSGATFFVKELSGSGSTQVATGAVWKVPDSVTFTFQACLAARGSRSDLFNQPFSVEIPGSPQVINVQTNRTSGCFNWKETMPYNFFAGQSGWIKLTRTIVGQGANEGKQQVVIAVNPWAVDNGARRDRGDAVIFMNSGDLRMAPAKIFETENVATALSGELQGSSRLIVQNVSIKSMPQHEGDKWVEMLVEVEMDPTIQSLDAQGNPSYQDVKDGQFDIVMQVMANNVGEKMDQKILLLGGANHAIGRSMNGRLKAEFSVRQQVKANQGNLEMVLQVQPHGLSAYKSLKPFNGIFRFGPGDVIKDQSGNLANQCMDGGEACSFNNIVSQAANYKEVMGMFEGRGAGPEDSFEQLKTKGYVLDNARYIFSNLKLRFTSILPGETATQRTVVYTAATCITDIQTGRPLANTPMTISYIHGDDGRVDMEPSTDIVKSTDESGCLSWNGQAFHKYYEPEEFFEKEVVITKGSGFKRHMKFYLNPWDDKFTFGWDSREFTKEFFDEIRSRKKVQSRFFLGDYSYHTFRFLYNIDQFMELEVQKWITLSLVPQVLRYSGIVNARKMVEHLRDGIYMMKVAIQKSYLDPRDNSPWLLRNSPQYQAELATFNGHEMAVKQYITTNIALVRVVDGVIIYPIELTMRDLRLMRVRANFLIQLETVDERLIQAYHEFRKQAITDQDLDRKLKEYKDKLHDGQSLMDVKREFGDLESAPSLIQTEAARLAVANAPDVQAAREDLEARVDKSQILIRESLKKLSSFYQVQKGSMKLKEFDPTDPTKAGAARKFPPGSFITDQFEVSKDVLDPLLSVLKLNDFSEVTLPKKEDIDLNIFLEPNSGLVGRSFVGPVIFLSNGYSDSMRATDNLDEAGCVDPKKGKDALRASVEELEVEAAQQNEVNRSETSLYGARQNNAFQFSQYFSALTHLCYKSVDKLMEEEKELKVHWQNVSQAAALKYNFVDRYNMDFISLTDEPLLMETPNCKNTAAKCMIETHDKTMPMSALESLINTDLGNQLKNINENKDTLMKRMRGIEFHATKPQWKPEEYAELFFKHSLDTKAALCNMMSHRIARELGAKGMTSVSESVIVEKINEVCGFDGGLIHDVKLHVERTGDYMFLGGLNLNLNVGEGFSVGTSEGWSAGVELTDIVGATAKGAAMALKPFNFKYGTSMSSSTGTSISESTYLVSQIARFELDLKAYERCAAVRLSDQSIHGLTRSWSTPKFMEWLGLGTVDFENAAVMDVFKHGLFICEGKTRKDNPIRKIRESYFYFTQHFTEGDMLDQADLYNQPWLLSLRGMRDFSVFVDKIRAQELADLPNFLYHLTGIATPNRKAWAVEHLLDAYRNVLPSFPGFYTVLEDSDMDIDAFALEQLGRPLEKFDRDELREVNHSSIMLEENKMKATVPDKPVDPIPTLKP